MVRKRTVGAFAVGAITGMYVERLCGDALERFLSRKMEDNASLLGDPQEFADLMEQMGIDDGDDEFL